MRQKKFYFQLIKALFFSLLAFYSCTDSTYLLENDTSEENIVSVSRAAQVHRNFEYDWENNSSVNINGVNVTLPWYSNAPSSLPYYITQDYKKEDGWIMIYNYITDPVLMHPNRDVFVFYNRLRGLLRIFYFNSQYPSQSGTSFAQITLSDRDTKLLNSSTTGRVCLPLSEKGKNVAYTTGISLTPVSGFSLGWNCFELELSYDDLYKNKHNTMTIAFYDKKVQTINLGGNINTTGKISYLVTNNNNPVGETAQNVFNSIASASGDEVSKLISIPDTTPPATGTKGALTTILGKVASSVISNVISGLTKSWTSSWGKTSQTYKTMDIKLSSRIDLSGTITQDLPSIVYPIQNALIPDSQPGNSIVLPISDEPLGVWNIKRIKPVEIGSHVFPTIENYSHYPYGSNSYPVIGDLGYYVQIHVPTYDKSDVVINPKVLDYISHYEVKSEVFHKKANNSETITDTTLITGHWKESWSKKYLDYKDTNYHISESYWRMLNSDNLSRRSTPDSYFDEKRLKFEAKVTVLLYPKSPFNDDVISLTRTFDCKTVKVPTPSTGRVLIGRYN